MLYLSIILFLCLYHNCGNWNNLFNENLTQTHRHTHRWTHTIPFSICKTSNKPVRSSERHSSFITMATHLLHYHWIMSLLTWYIVILFINHPFPLMYTQHLYPLHHHGNHSNIIYYHIDGNIGWRTAIWWIHQFLFSIKTITWTLTCSSGHYLKTQKLWLHEEFPYHNGLWARLATISNYAHAMSYT